MVIWISVVSHSRLCFAFTEVAALVVPYSQSLYQVCVARPRGRKARAAKKPTGSSQPPLTRNVIMPSQKQEGLEADVAGFGVETLVVADSVYNKELRYLITLSVS